METICITLVLVDVAREPIDWLTALLASCTNNSYDIICLAPSLLFLPQWQLTFASCPKQTNGNHSHQLSLG
jgi:hypothetical protein